MRATPEAPSSSWRGAPARALVLAACALALAGGGEAVAQQAPPAPVRVDSVRSEKVRERRRVTGNVRAHERSLVAAREAGVALEVAVREGQHVEAGAVLARVDDDRLRLDNDVVVAEKAAAQSVVAQRKDELERAKRDVESLRALAARDATNPREVSDAETEAGVSASRLRNAESLIAVLDARIAVLKQRLDDTVVRAPFAGTVVSRRATTGSWLSEGAVVAELITDDVEAWFDVPQRDLAHLTTAGGAVRIESEAGTKPFETSEIRVLRDVDPRSRTFPAVVPVPASSGLVPGMSVTAWMPTAAEAEHLMVANDAILRSDTGPYIYVATPGAEGAPHAAMPVPVEVLFAIDGRSAVRSPQLAAGALAVVEGNERLFPGAPVLPMQSPSQSPAKAPGSDR